MASKNQLRKQDRVQGINNYKVAVLLEDGKILTAMVVNYSPNGLAFHVEEPISKGSSVELHLTKNTTIKLSIIYCVNQVSPSKETFYQVGATYSDKDNETHSLLESLIKT